MADEPQLQEGADDADWVRYLQDTLIAWGHEPGPIDGTFGPRTRSAVEAFQMDSADLDGDELAVDGIVGRRTWDALTGGVGAAPADDASGTEPFALDHPVDLVLQETHDTCWAASCAMLLGRSEHEVIATVGEAGGTGADEPESFAHALELELVPPMPMTPEGWTQLLERGLVMVGIPYHYIVVAGIESDGTFAGTRLHIFDPASGERWADYPAIEHQYEIDATAGADLFQRREISFAPRRSLRADS